MTRKDYVMISNVVREMLNDIARDEAREGLSDRNRALVTGERIAVRGLAHRLGDQLRQDNPRFDRKQFLQACGFPA
jgi:hypothetical protein